MRIMIKILLVANTDWFLYQYRLSLAQFLRARGLDVVLVSPGGKIRSPHCGQRISLVGVAGGAEER